MMKTDPTNIEILRHLRDGKKSFQEIAKDLGISENTVRARANRLMEKGLLDIAGLVNPECIPGHRITMVGVRLSTMDMVEKGEEFSRLRGVVSVAVVTGRFDLLLTVLMNEDFGLLEFYTEEVAKIKDVQSIETFVVCKGFNLKVPYIL